MNTRTVEGLAMQGRRWDIDWLRIAVVVLMLAPFHTYRVFDGLDDWYVKNDLLSTALNWYLTFGSLVGMQLLFLLAGSATWFALRRRSAGQYAKERLQRLLIPLLFGLLVLIPPQTYFGLRNHSDYVETFLGYYPRFFQVFPEDLNGYYLGGFTLGHLWFIAYLFIISLIALPLFVLLKREAGRRLTAGLAVFLTQPGLILLLVVPILVTRRIIGFDPNPLYFLTWFVYGFLLLAEERFGEAIDRHKAVALSVGVVALALTIAPLYARASSPLNVPGWLQLVFLDVAAWFIVVGLLGYGRRYLNSPPKRRLAVAFLGYFGEGSYPFYILHQTVIVVIGFYVVRWDASVPAKYLVILGATYLGTILFYELLVRRFNAVRFLFGMRPKRKPPKATA